MRFGGGRVWGIASCFPSCWSLFRLKRNLRKPKTAIQQMFVIGLIERNIASNFTALHRIVNNFETRSKTIVFLSFLKMIVPFLEKNIVFAETNSLFRTFEKTKKLLFFFKLRMNLSFSTINFNFSESLLMLSLFFLTREITFIFAFLKDFLILEFSDQNCLKKVVRDH